jgi:hypothetical protein
MNESRIARGLMFLGAGVGILSVVVWGLEFRLLNLPDWMVRVAMIKLAFISSFGLLAAGAYLGRHAHDRSLPRADRDLLPSEPAEPIRQSSARNTPDEIIRRNGPAD